MKKTLALATALLSSSTLANSFDHYLSLGYTQVDASYASESEKMDGVGFTYSRFERRQQIGVILLADYASSSSSALDASYYDVMGGIVYRPEKLNWLRVYPMVGASVFKGNVTSTAPDSDSEMYLSYGVGLQASIPNTKVFFDASYKNIDADFGDASAFNIGIGLRF
ncbi:outer membrane beta-barrel protein [Vibrio sp. SCSIO 43135]|uniref:outer membrane beta-barrel protein n=1 Tax=Vibrio sp. SCSIO 43135 TaxID=2819096 RepID=UPI002074B032|nr:outer membrane beta-barrel protein [Vibrio sp. SCSIO 43135]USD42417.1 outer membrane beta-barrel protein [Vibrio sp. SCSIO 43135]